MPDENQERQINFLRKVVERRLEKRPELVCTEIAPSNDHFAVHIRKRQGDSGKQIEVSLEWVEQSMAGGDAKLPEQFELLLDLYFPETFAGAAGQGM